MVASATVNKTSQMKKTFRGRLTLPFSATGAPLHGLKLLRSDSNIYICGSWSDFAMEESRCRLSNGDTKTRGCLGPGHIILGINTTRLFWGL